MFAQTDEAFAALPEGTLDFLLLPENVEVLANILLYHVTAGELTAADVISSNELEMLQGDELEIDVEDGMVFVNDAKIITTDVFASNGVIHVIDAVLMPPTDDDADDDDDDGDEDEDEDDGEEDDDDSGDDD